MCHLLEVIEFSFKHWPSIVYGLFQNKNLMITKHIVLWPHLLILGAIFEAPRSPLGLSLSLLGSSWRLSERPWALPHAESTSIYNEAVTALNSLRGVPGGALEPPRCSAEASNGAP